MSDSLNYIIGFSDDRKPKLSIAPEARNYDTTLILFGRGTTDWGYNCNTNLIRLLENFCNPYLPGYAGQVLEGQLWYNSDAKQLNVCTKSTKEITTDGTTSPAELTWKPLTNIPSPDLTGIVTTKSLDIALADYIPLSGSILPMTGSLLVEPLESFSNPLRIANKKYVDSLVCACGYDETSLLDKFVSSAGAETTTTITLFDNQNDIRSAAPKKYVDLKNRYTQTALSDITSPTVTPTFIGYAIAVPADTANLYVNYNGYITIPATTGNSAVVCECNLPFTLQTDYFITVSSKVLNGKDTSGTTDTGVAGDAYAVKVSTTKFEIHTTAKPFDMVVNISLNGMKDA